MPEAPYVFVSYASVDRERVLPVVERLEAAGVSVWIDREGIHGGENYGQIITAAIKDAAVIMVMASDAALASRNVRQELALGWRFEKAYLPLLLDPVTVPDEVAYWLEAAQWIELLQRPEREWLADVGQALARHAITVHLPTAQMPTAPVHERPLLVGREREQAILQEQLDQMLSGKGGTVLVGGEAGIGKTTLVEDLSAVAEDAGVLVLWGHAYDLSVTPPYGPWLEIWRQYRAVDDASLPPLPLFIFDADELTKVGSQDALFVQVAEFLRAVAAERPLMLVLDDFHWFDQASLDFARFLARQVVNQRLLLVATYRTDELHRRHPLYTLLPLLVREAGAERLEVRPLDKGGHRALIQQHYALADIDRDRLEQYLEDHAEGNPLYAGELLRTLEDAGALFEGEDGWQLGDLEQVRVPPMLRQVIEGRLARLPETTRELLDVAAIIGQDVAFDVWATVAGVDEGALLEAVESAAHAAVLVALSDGSGARFQHALLREALYENVLPLRRRLWHRKTAETLAATRAPDPDQVAYHYQQASDERAVEWLITAGERARRAYVWATAAERWDAALARLTEQQAPVLERVGITMRIALVMRYADPRRAVALLEEAAKLATETSEAGVAILISFLAGLSRFNTGDVRAGMPQIIHSAQAFRELSFEERVGSWVGVHFGASAYELSLVGSLILMLVNVGRLREANAWGETFRSEPVPELLPGQPGSPYADGLSGQANLTALLGQVADARRFADQARVAYRVIGHHWRLAQLLGTELELIQIPYFPEELNERQKLGDEALLAAREAKGGGGIQHIQLYLLPLLWIEGAWGAALEVVLASDGLQNWVQHQYVQHYVAQLGNARGDVAAAQHAITAVLANGPATEPGEVSIVEALALQRLAAAMALDAHDLPTARAWLEAHDRWLAWSGAVLGRAEGALGWAQYHHADGDTIQARTAGEQALAQANDPRQPLALIAVHRFLGQLDTEDTQFDAAEDHLGESLKLAEACAAPFERALTLLEMAKLRAARGQRDEARTLLTEVRDICDSLGARPTLERVAELDWQLSESQPSR